MKHKIFFILGLLILGFAVLNPSNLGVYAQQSNSVKSNTFFTKVGEPTEPKPGSGGIGVGSGEEVITCPLSKDGSGSFNITCGTALNKASNGCGHGVPPRYPACTRPPYASCPFSKQLTSAIDVQPANSNGGGVAVYLPFINGKESVQWKKVDGPISLVGPEPAKAYWGEKLEYEASLNGKTYRLDLTHLGKQSLNSGASTSGDQVGTTLVGLDGGSSGHLHTAISVDGKWLDAISEAKLCIK